MPRKPVTFLNTVFESQTEYRKYVKKIIYNDIGICNDIKNTYPDLYKILIEILKRHPDFNSKSKNMCNIKIIHNKINDEGFETVIIKNDGSEVDIAWTCAITGKYKSEKHKLMSAMRSSIDPQIKQFRREHINDSCEICGNIVRLDVDHNDEKNSAFSELVSNFMEKNNHIKISNKFEELNDGTHRKKFSKEDAEFQDKWSEYHRDQASLRMLCHNCNISREKTKNKFIL